MSYSIIQERGPVTFPDFQAQRVYMLPFFKRDGLPEGLARWQPTVDAMLHDVDTSLPIYLMVDQAVVSPNTTHRRPGVHVDGYWNPGKHSGHRSVSAHGARPGTHTPQPPQRGRHDFLSERHHLSASDWNVIDFSSPEAIMLASNVSASAAYVGEYDEQLLRHGGDASAVDLLPLSRVLLDAGKVYAGNVAVLHESLPVTESVERTLVRLNVPGWSPLH